MKKLFSIIIMCAMVLPVCAIDEQEENVQLENTPAAENIYSQNLSEQDVNVYDREEVVAVPNEEISENVFKKPVSKRHLAKKFIIAMVCVVGCSILLFGALSIYNKIREILLADTYESPQTEQPLDTPADLEDAVKSFVEKTSWDN